MPESLHFLQPQWLWLLVPLGLLLWRLWRRPAGDNPWRRVLEPGLQPLLLGVSDGQGRQGRRHWLVLLGCGWLLAVLALANPVWERAPSPVYESRNARVVVLDLSLSMLTRDIAPDRLTRARFKVEDILRFAGEGQLGLVVFAGDAFTVTPLTRDVATLRSQLRALEPAIMPVQGSRADLGLRQAAQLLRQAGHKQGQVLLLADGVEGETAAVAAAELRQQGYRIGVLGVGTTEGAPLTNADGRWVYAPDGKVIVPKLEAQALRRVAAEGGGSYVTISDGDSDVRALLASEVSGVRETGSGDPAEAPRWKERGPWLVLLLLPLAALAFRRGWLFSVALCGVLLTPPPPALAAGDATVNADGAGPWERLWHTPEQLADRALRSGHFEDASALAQDPLRRGAAHYRQGDYTAALADFEQATGAQASYNRGNTLARLGRYQQAIEAYQEALEAQPELQDAAANKKAVEDLLERMQRPQTSQQQQPSPQAQQGESPPQDSSGEQPSQQQGQSSPQAGEAGQPEERQAQQGQPGQQGQPEQQGQQGQPDKGQAGAEPGEDSRADASAGEHEQGGEAQSAQAAKQAAGGEREDSQPRGGAGEERSEGKQAGTDTTTRTQAGGEEGQESDRNVFAEALDEMARREQTDKAPEQSRAGSSAVSDDGAPSGQGRAEAERLNSEERLAAEQWLRRIPDDPGGLLRRKFQYQYQQRQRGQQAADTQGW